jgi:hypothetical protein
MIFNQSKTQFYCDECKKWISIDPCDYLIIEEKVFCFELHFCGYEWDLFPCPYYYLYHKEGICRCLQDKCNCFGREEDCENPLARNSYKQDLEER